MIGEFIRRTGKICCGFNWRTHQARSFLPWGLRSPAHPGDEPTASLHSPLLPDRLGELKINKDLAVGVLAALLRLSLILGLLVVTESCRKEVDVVEVLVFA
jgi:hypothetical protein